MFILLSKNQGILFLTIHGRGMKRVKMKVSERIGMNKGDIGERDGAFCFCKVWVVKVIVCER